MGAAWVVAEPPVNMRAATAIANIVRSMCVYLFCLELTRSLRERSISNLCTPMARILLPFYLRHSDLSSDVKGISGRSRLSVAETCSHASL